MTVSALPSAVPVIPADVAAAVAKFGTTGPLACPMTTKEVAYILGIEPNTVTKLVYLKKFARRFTAFAGFHPDDIRAYLSAKEA